MAISLMKVASTLLTHMLKKDSRASIAESMFSVEYLTAFGYLEKEAWGNVDKVIQAIKKFQKFFGAKADGVIGPKTLSAMQQPRCGCPDIVQPNNPDHAEYLALQQFSNRNLSKWNKTGLKYYIKSYVGGKLSKSTQTAILDKAWKAWTDVCGLTITRTSRASEADLVCDTGEGRRSNFDGPGGTLAWAYLPSGNDRQLLMRFDLGETWIDNPRERGILLFNVACHEFGHMLGLDHSKQRGALMAPYYNPAIATPQWDDDIPRVQHRYGKNVTTTPVPPTNDGTTEDGAVYRVTCKDLQVEGYTLFSSV